jgi:hypothetical protein
VFLKKIRTTIAFLLTAMLATGAATVAFASEDIPPASERETEISPPPVTQTQPDETLIPEATQDGVSVDIERDGTRRIYFFSSEGDPISEEREFVAAEETPVVQESPSLTLADYQALNDAVGEDTNRGFLSPALGAQYNDSIRVNEFDDIQDTDTFDVPVMALPETPVPIAADAATDTATADTATDPAAVANSPALDGTAGSNNPDTGAGTTTDDDLNPEIVTGTTSQDNFNPNIVTGDLANPETGAASSLPLLVTALAAIGSVPVLLRKKEK